MSKGILEENSCAYAQFPAEEKEPVNVSLQVLDTPLMDMCISLSMMTNGVIS